MPTIVLRDVAARLKARLVEFARARGLSVSAAATTLLTDRLDDLEARAERARSLHAGRTPEERSAAGRHAVQARWTKEDTHGE